VELKPFNIGNVVVDPPAVLAPMAGYTDAAMRLLCREFHCGLAMTEVVTAEGLWRGSRPSLHLLETLPAEGPVGAHIYGREPSSMAAAAVVIEKLGRFDFIDINCGCPVRKMVRRGAGVALMKEPERIGQIVSAVREAVSLPVTVKTRLGLSPNRHNVSEVAQAVEEAGGAAVFIHARYASHKHAGRPDWEALARVKRERSIPVVGNGGVEAAEDVWRMRAETGVDGVMIGRAAIGNPWIFEEVWRRSRGESIAQHSMAEHRAVIERHLERLIALVEKEQLWRRHGAMPAEQAAARLFRGHLFKYLCGWEGWGEVRRTLSSIQSRRDVMEAVDRVLTAQRETRRRSGAGPGVVTPTGRREAVRVPSGSEMRGAQAREERA